MSWWLLLACVFVHLYEAFVVRLVTRRFIGEYDQNKGQLHISSAAAAAFFIQHHHDEQHHHSFCFRWRGPRGIKWAYWKKPTKMSRKGKLVNEEQDYWGNIGLLKQAYWPTIQNMHGYYFKMQINHAQNYSIVT